ncbi:RING-type domain-containing protein [Entamoeba marina]
MTTDQQILWVYTNSSLYRITSKSITNDKIDLTSFNSFEKLRVGVHRELDSSVGLVKTFVLYCWCVILDVRAIQIATKQKCNEQQEIDILYSTLQNEIPSKTGIDHHIIRYIIRQCGIDSIFIKYCSICNDIEGYIEYLMEREEHDIVFEQLTLLFQESSVFQIPNQRRMAQKLLEEYFSVLFFKNNDKMVEMLSNIEFRTFPSFFTALILYPDTQVSINFAKILLRNYESKGQFNEVICEFIFWELLRHGSDMELFEFLKEKELYLSCVETLPAKHYFNKHKRSYLYILEKKGMIKEWITTGIELIVESRNEDELIPLFEKAKELNETEFQEQAIYILNAFIKIGGTQENVIHYLKTYQIDITKTLEILPNEWHSPQLIELITENIQKNEKETNRINTELNKTIEITQNAKDFSKAMYVVEEWTCSICKEIFKRNEEVVIFPCSHAFHQTCIDIEFQKNKTPYAIEHSSNAKHYDDECLLCGQHQVELINLVYVQEDEYWKL